MLTITPVNYRNYSVTNRNNQKIQNNADNNLNFKGGIDITKNKKIRNYALAGALALLSAVGFTKCSGNDSDKYHEVELRYPERWSWRTCSDHIKIEDGCSFENNGKKYVMSNGKLMAYNKETHKWSEADYIETREYQVEVINAVASAKNEEEGIVVLSKKDIKKRQKNPQDIEYRDNGYGSGSRILSSDGNTLKIKERSGYIGGDADLYFRYDADKETDYVLGMKYLNLSPEFLAGKISAQISGYSNNDKTLAMLNAIPSDKLKDVAIKYREYNSRGLLEDLGREFCIDRRDVADLASRLDPNQSRYSDLYNKVFNKKWMQHDIWDYAELREMDNIICDSNK